MAGLAGASTPSEWPTRRVDSQPRRNQYQVSDVPVAGRSQTTKGGRVLATWLWILIIVLVIFALFGGVGYYRR
jgi:hypothetical protein